MRIVSLGASGATGRQLVIAALNRGHHVVAVVRRPEVLDGLAHSNLSVRQGDVQQPSTIASACEGADGVISTLGFSRGGPSNILSAGARAVLDARPQRVVWMGSFGGRRLPVQGRAPLRPRSALRPHLIAQQRSQLVPRNSGEKRPLDVQCPLRDHPFTRESQDGLTLVVVPVIFCDAPAPILLKELKLRLYRAQLIGSNAGIQ